MFAIFAPRQKSSFILTINYFSLLMNIFTPAKWTAAAMMLSASLAAVAQYPASSYTLSDDGTTLVKWTGTETAINMNSDPALAAVTAIDISAFNGNKNITSIVVGDKVTSIGKFAFMDCYALTSATLPNTLSLLDNAAFSGCDALTSVNIPALVTELKNSVFYGCSSLAEVTLPSTLTQIGSGTFAQCSALTAITVPEGVTELGEEAFTECTSLATVSLPETLTIIGPSAFEECSGLKNINFPADLSEVNSYAFAESGLENIDMSTIADEVYFGFNVFDSNKMLKSAILPANLTGGNTLFVYCSALESITVPETWTEVPVKMCQYCTSLKSLDLGNVETIKNTAFFGCSSLTDITWSEKLTAIDWNVFYDCSSITELNLPASLLTVDDYSFSDMSALRTVKVGKEALSFGANCFEGCTALEAFYCEAATPPALGSAAFANTSQASATLYVPAESKTAYSDASQWKNFGQIADINSGISDIENGIFTVTADKVCFGQRVDRADLFSTSGQMTRTVVNADEMPLTGLHPGVYIVRAAGASVRIVVR